MIHLLGIPSFLLLIATIGGVAQAIIHSRILRRGGSTNHGAWLRIDLIVGVAVVLFAFGPWPLTWNLVYGIVLMAAWFSFTFRSTLNLLQQWGLFWMGTTAKYDRFWMGFAWFFNTNAKLADQRVTACYLAIVAEWSITVCSFINVAPSV